MRTTCRSGAPCEWSTARSTGSSRPRRGGVRRSWLAPLLRTLGDLERLAAAARERDDAAHRAQVEVEPGAVRGGPDQAGDRRRQLVDDVLDRRRVRVQG